MGTHNLMDRPGFRPSGESHLQKVPHCMIPCMSHSQRDQSKRWGTDYWLPRVSEGEERAGRKGETKKHRAFLNLPADFYFNLDTFGRPAKAFTWAKSLFYADT